MSNARRMTLWIEQIRDAAETACSYVGGMDFATFERDTKVVWDTVNGAVPELTRQLPELLLAARDLDAE